MTPDLCKQLVMNAWATFETHDPALIGAVFQRDAHWMAVGFDVDAEAPAGASLLAGREAIAQVLSTRWFDLFQGDGWYRVRGLHCEGHTVILEQHGSATSPRAHRDGTGHCFVIELGDDGRIRRVRAYAGPAGTLPMEAAKSA